MQIHEKIFGRWQDKSISRVVDLEPGLYFHAAKTFGLKGMLGGTHSWITHVTEDLKHTVIEVTDIETLLVQKCDLYFTFNKKCNRYCTLNEKKVFVSNRDGGQLWFGQYPKTIYLGKIDLNLLLDWTVKYPKIDHTFSILTANCNTFTSWILHLLGAELWSGIGAKKWPKAAKY